MPEGMHLLLACWLAQPPCNPVDRTGSLRLSGPVIAESRPDRS